ncbi:MAG: serine/threonine-protein kinase [Pirellulaceae bacterium]
MNLSSNALQPCPSVDDYHAAVGGRLSEDQADRILEHVENCNTCRDKAIQWDRLTDHLISSLRDSSEICVSSDSAKPLGANNTAAADPPSEVADSESAYQRMIERSQSFGSQATGSLPESLEPGTLVRDYEIIRRIGWGGMGTVFLAMHTRLKRRVALKFISSHLANASVADSRFKSEMEAIGDLDHPNIVRALDAGEDKGRQYLAMDYIEGISVSELLKEHGPLNPFDAAEVVRQSARGLAYIHSKGRVHRDIKPSNLMLSTTGRIQILDLGLARLPQYSEGEVSGRLLGSLPYLAPEQASNSQNAGPAADIYSLGCTLFQLLTAQPPNWREVMMGSMEFTAVDESRLIDNAIEPLELGVPNEVLQVLKRMLKPNWNERVSDAKQVIELVTPICQGADLGKLASVAIHNEQGEPALDFSYAPQPANAPPQRSKATHSASVRSLAIRKIAATGLAICLTIAAAWWGSKAYFDSGETTRIANAAAAEPAFESGGTAAAVASNTPPSKTLETHEVWGKDTEGTEFRIRVRAGEEFAVAIKKKGDEDFDVFRAWDLIELMLKAPDAFDYYQQFGVLTSDSQPLFPFAPSKTQELSQEFEIVRIQRSASNEGATKVAVREPSRSLEFQQTGSRWICRISRGQQINKFSGRSIEELLPMLEDLSTDSLSPEEYLQAW